MGNKGLIKRRESKQVVSFRLEMLLHVFLWFLIGFIFAQVIQSLFQLIRININISRLGCGAFFAIIFGYIGWILYKISSRK